MVVNETIENAVVCPNCLGGLKEVASTSPSTAVTTADAGVPSNSRFGLSGAYCDDCDTIFPWSDTGVLDLRLPRTKRVELTVQIGPTYQNPEPRFGLMRPDPQPAVTYTENELPLHLTSDMASYIPKAARVPGTAPSLCLDLGCGNGEYRSILEQAGFDWVGFDYQHPGAPLWADAHALPFADNSFDFIISLAVLEHIKHPPVMLREIHRVLKPGGTYLGSVTYLVPFHDWASYYNMTHHGVWAAMEDAGLETEFVLGERDYLAIRALAMFGLFPGLGRRLAYSLVQPIVWLHKIYWSLRRKRGNPQASRDWQSILNTGSFVYRVHKRDCNDPEMQ